MLSSSWEVVVEKPVKKIPDTVGYNLRLADKINGNSIKGVNNEGEGQNNYVLKGSNRKHGNVSSPKTGHLQR